MFELLFIFWLVAVGVYLILAAFNHPITKEWNE